MTRSEFDSKVVEGLNAKLNLEKLPKSLQNMLSGYQFDNAIVATTGGVDLKAYLAHPYKYQDQSDVHFKAYEKDGDERHIADAVRAVRNTEPSRWFATTIECRYISAMTGEPFGGKNYSVWDLNKTIRKNADKLYSGKSREHVETMLEKHMDMAFNRCVEITATKQREQKAKTVEWKISFKPATAMLEFKEPVNFGKLSPEIQKQLADEIRDVRYAYVGGGKEIYEPDISVKLDGRDERFYDLSKETRNIICDQLAAGHDRGTASLHEDLKQEVSNEHKTSLSDVKSIAAAKREQQVSERKNERTRSMDV